MQRWRPRPTGGRQQEEAQQWGDGPPAGTLWSRALLSDKEEEDIDLFHVTWTK